MFCALNLHVYKNPHPQASTSPSQHWHQHPQIVSSVVLFTEILLRFFGVRNDLEKKSETTYMWNPDKQNLRYLTKPRLIFKKNPLGYCCHKIGSLNVLLNCLCQLISLNITIAQWLKYPVWGSCSHFWIKVSKINFLLKNFQKNIFHLFDLYTSFASHYLS